MNLVHHVLWKSFSLSPVSVMESTSMEPQRGSVVFGDENGMLSRLGRFKERALDLNENPHSLVQRMCIRILDLQL
ncbi:hypothetical protein Pyn_34690 [Prunus yedoensis var. nudiflora]|uniref:Uncharacterized protein n=1 Tax=Prunus yedoensis var. nudiflora TaxID=2094558 RepID=A0A314Y949_PRUYE|nr:hypothetical protein Pyn_34690 [Prunus yedoensis var. nudiflora]